MADFTSRFNDLLNRYSGSDSGLAETLGVSKQTISAWKNGVRSPKRPTVRIIADYFGVGVPWLNGITDDEHETGYDYIRRGLSPSPAASAMLGKIRDGLPDYADNDPDRAALLQTYDSLNDRGRADLLKYARYLSADPDMTQDGASSDVTA